MGMLQTPGGRDAPKAARYCRLQVSASLVFAVVDKKNHVNSYSRAPCWVMYGKSPLKALLHISLSFTHTHIHRMYMTHICTNVMLYTRTLHTQCICYKSTIPHMQQHTLPHHTYTHNFIDFTHTHTHKFKCMYCSDTVCVHTIQHIIRTTQYFTCMYMTSHITNLHRTPAHIWLIPAQL